MPIYYTPVYPSALYAEPSNLQTGEVVEAEHVNVLRGEVRAIEASLGTNPARGRTIDETTYVVGPVTDFANVADRLAKLEAAAMRDFSAFFVSKAGGSVISRTNTAPGVGIKTLAPGGVEALPALEVLVAGSDGWGDSLATRSKIKLWGSGLIEADKVRFGASTGELSEHGMYVGSASIDATGALTMPNGTTLTGVASPRFSTTIGNSVTGIRMTATAVSAIPLQVVDASAAVKFQISYDGSLTAGGVALNAASGTVTAGGSVLTGTSLSLGSGVSIDQSQMTINNGSVTAKMSPAGFSLVDSSGAVLAALTGSYVRFGAAQFSTNSATLAGGSKTTTWTASTGTLNFSQAALISAVDNISLDNGVSHLTVGHELIGIAADTRIDFSADTASASILKTDDFGSTFRIGSAYLSSDRLTLSSGAHFSTSSARTDVYAPSTHRLKLGVAGTRPGDPSYKQYMEVGTSGTTVTGDLNLVDNVTTIWPENQDAPYTVWLNTKPARTDAVSDLRPTYWDPLLSYDDDNSPEASTRFLFVAPASGDVKITLSAELGGNVSRSAISYQIHPIGDDGSFGWTPVVTCGQSHCISFNAPAVDVPGDWYYTNLSNTFITRLTPGKTYLLLLRGQRAWPGTDATQYFPGHPNYGPGYPWGRRFKVDYLRVMVEPVFTSSRMVSSV